MRAEYEFIGGSGQRLRVAESSSTGLDVWCEKDDFPAGWETADVDLDAGAFLDAAAELLRVVRLLDAYDELAREFVAKVDRGEAYSVRTYASFKKLLDRKVGEP